MIKLFYTILYLIKKLIYKTDTEYDITNVAFNTKKFIVYIILVLVFGFNLGLALRISKMANDSMKLKLELMDCKFLLEKIKN